MLQEQQNQLVPHQLRCCGMYHKQSARVTPFDQGEPLLTKDHIVECRVGDTASLNLLIVWPLAGQGL